MRTITKITTQQKNKERYNIFTDHGNGEQYDFSVDEAVLVNFGLKKGMVLDELLYTEICYEDNIRKAYNLALQYLGRRMRSEYEVRTYLSKKEVERPLVQEVILKLYQHRFLDDEEYAMAFVRTQMNTTDKGPKLIRQELKEKGIEAALIEKALAQYSFGAQVETAEKLCRKYAGRYKRDSAKVLQQKLEGMLLRKGFTYDILSAVVSGIVREQTSDDDEMEALRYQAEKLRRKYKGGSSYEYERKMKQALYRKGFSLDCIENYLNTMEND